MEKESAEASELQKTAEQEYENIQSQWAKLQINELAKLLKPGEACPVCGSLEHPSPAFGDEKTVYVTENQVKKQKKNMTKPLPMLQRKRPRQMPKQKSSANVKLTFWRR